MSTRSRAACSRLSRDRSAAAMIYSRAHIAVTAAGKPSAGQETNNLRQPALKHLASGIIRVCPGASTGRSTALLCSRVPARALCAGQLQEGSQEAGGEQQCGPKGRGGRGVGWPGSTEGDSRAESRGRGQGRV